jgi:hypothetical protein
MLTICYYIFLQFYNYAVKNKFLLFMKANYECMVYLTEPNISKIKGKVLSYTQMFYMKVNKLKYTAQF